MNGYILHLVTLSCILTTAVVALQLLVSGAGLLCVAQSVFLAIGAYSSALLTTRLGFDAPAEILVSAVLSLLVSLCVSVPSLRLRDDYFAIATFGLQMIVSGVLVNWVSVTNGPSGIANIKPLSVFGKTMDSPYALLISAAALAVATVAIAESIHASRFGLVLQAIKKDERFAKSLGKKTILFKIKIVSLSAVLTSLSGVLYAHFLSYIDPSSFTLMDSIELLSMVIIGGSRPLGAAAGTIALVLLPEGLRFLGLPAALAANLRQILYGTLLIVVISLRPQGVFSREVTAAEAGS